ncbi:hypothetical protein KJ657_04365 [Patescibacteria group bacterium]|nr:hypothetical protein [Patescibacteria group bacterium]MBU1016298.1 hypothetical protein [Patescibacteria group bacterium]MBU1685574.1 hypothetical protein [Patescibacteria group bacterium]MBU1938499.1 hypothetical protein [Patescibacteria group bacterium]
MNRFRIWLISGIVVIIALGGLVYLRGKLPEEAVRIPTTVQVTEPAAKPKGFAKPPEPGPQEKIKDDSEAMVEALNSGDISDCDKITWSGELKKQCEDNLNYASILKSGDASQCDRLNSQVLKRQCYDKIYMTTAVDKKDPSICDLIKDETLKLMCLDQVQMILSRYAKTADDCSVIASASLRRQCEDNFYMHSSAKKLDAEGCNNISDGSLASQCRQTVTKNIEVKRQSEIAAKNAATPKTLQEILELCDSLSDAKAITCKNAVYPQLAFDEKDLSYCDKISDESGIAECRREQGEKLNTYYLRQSLASNNKSLCDKILDEELKQLCQSS